MTRPSPLPRPLSGFCLSAMLALALAGCGKDEKKVDPFALMEGEAIYKAECAGCHGKDMEGQPGWPAAGQDGHLPAPPLAGKTPASRRTFPELVSITRLGVVPPQTGQGGSHPAFAGKLTERQVENVVHFIQSRWPTAPARP